MTEIVVQASQILYLLYHGVTEDGELVVLPFGPVVPHSNLSLFLSLFIQKPRALLRILFHDSVFLEAHSNYSFLAFFQVDPEGSKKFTPTQVYPEMVGTGIGSKMKESFMENASWGSVRDQERPRIITTHLYGDKLPKGLISKDGKGRMIVVLRNLKVRDSSSFSLVCVQGCFRPAVVSSALHARAKPWRDKARAKCCAQRRQLHVAS